MTTVITAITVEMFWVEEMAEELASTTEEELVSRRAWNEEQTHEMVAPGVMMVEIQKSRYLHRSDWLIIYNVENTRNTTPISIP